MAAQDASIQNETRHSIFVNRFGSGLANTFDPFLASLRKEISFTLFSEGESTLKGRKLRQVLAEIKDIQKGIYSEYTLSLLETMEEFSEHEIDFELKSLDDVILSDAVELVKPAPVQVWAAVNTTPMVFPDSHVNVQMKSFIGNWTKAEIDKVNSIITTGFLNGDTSQTIARTISGKGGSLDKSTRRNNNNIVRTSINHISATARTKTMQENDDIVIGYTWLSTLDSRTSSECRSLDKREFKWSDSFKPMPPQHIGCRSTTTPLLDKRFNLDTGKETRPSIGSDGVSPTSAKTNYYDFLGDQSVAFQDSVLGPVRGQLFRKGGLTSKQFADLTVDQKFRPITLDEMKKQDPLSFEKAGL